MNKSGVGFIYVIQMDGFPIYKIGRSVDVPKRLGQIGIQLPFPYRLIYAYRVPDVELFERKIHEIHAKYRLNGEWFLLTECLLARARYFLLSVQAAHQIDSWIYAIEQVPDAGQEICDRVQRVIANLDRRMNRRSNLANTYHAHDALLLESGGLQ